MPPSMRARYRHYKSGNTRILLTPQQKSDVYSAATYREGAHHRTCVGCGSHETVEVRKKNKLKITGEPYSPSPLWYRVEPRNKECDRFFCYKCWQSGYAKKYWARNKEELKKKWRERRRRRFMGKTLRMLAAINKKKKKKKQIYHK